MTLQTQRPGIFACWQIALMTRASRAASFRQLGEHGECVSVARKLKTGFTLVELLLVMGIMALLFSIGAVGFFGVQGNQSLNQGAAVLVADLRSQQTKAMTGVTVGGVEQAGYGVYFGTSEYILFNGTSYNVSDPNNVVIELPQGVEVSGTTFSGAQVVFERASGEALGFVSGQDSVTLTSIVSNGASRTVRVNELGVIVEGL